MLDNLNYLFLWWSSSRGLLLHYDRFGGKLAGLLSSRRLLRHWTMGNLGLLLHRDDLRLLLLNLWCLNKFLLNNFLNHLRLLRRCGLDYLLGYYLGLKMLRLRLLLLLRCLRLNHNLLCWLRLRLLQWLLDDLECLRTSLLDDLLYLLTGSGLLLTQMRLNYLRRLLISFQNLLRRAFDADSLALLVGCYVYRFLLNHLSLVLHLAGHLGHNDLLALLVDKYLLWGMRLRLYNLMGLQLGIRALRGLLQDNDGLLGSSCLRVLRQ